MSGTEIPPSRRIRAPRTARYHLLGPAPHRAPEVWFVLHGYRQLAGRFLRRFRPLDDGRKLFVAPEALSRFYVDPSEGRHGPEHRVGASWMTRVEREDEIRDYVEYLDLVAREVLGEREVAPARVRLLGFSQGAHTAARWAVLGERPPDQLVLWGAHLPPDLPPERAPDRLSGLDLVLVEGREDPARDQGRRRDDDERLRGWGVAFRRLEHPGGHRLDTELLSSIAAEEPPPAQSSPTNDTSGTSS